MNLQLLYGLNIHMEIYIAGTGNVFINSFAVYNTSQL